MEAGEGGGVEDGFWWRQVRGNEWKVDSGGAKGETVPKVTNY